MNKVIEDGLTGMMHEYGRHLTKALANKYGFDLEEAWEHLESLEMKAREKGPKKVKITSASKKPKDVESKKAKEPNESTDVEPKKATDAEPKVLKKSKKTAKNTVTPQIPLLKDGDLEENICIEVINGKKYCIEEITGSVYDYKTENDGVRGELIGIFKDGQVDYITS